MENWKAIVFLLAFSQGVILSFALIVKGLGRERFNLFLGLILFTLSLELLNAWGMQAHYHSRADAIPFWNLQTYLILPPSLWFFCQLTTLPAFVLRKKHLFFFLPAVVEVIVRSGKSIYSHFSGKYFPSLLDNSAWFFTTEILPIIGMAVVLCIYGRKIILFDRSKRKQAAPLSLGQYIRLYGLFGFLFILTFLWATGVILDWPVFSIIEAIVTLFIFTLGYFGYLNTAFFTLPVLAGSKPSEKSAFIQYDDKKQLERLMALFQQDALHTQPQLSLEDVSGKLNLPVRYVSFLVNTYCASNFNNFINGFRVEEVIRKLGNPSEQHKTILALALEAGFNSKSTFNSVFKQHTGKSPSDYLLVRK